MKHIKYMRRYAMQIAGKKKMMQVKKKKVPSLRPWTRTCLAYLSWDRK